MATVPQSPWFCSVKSFKPILIIPSPNPNPRRISSFKTLKVSSSSSSSSSQSSSSEPIETDPVKLAFEKAKAYKKLKQQPNSSIGIITQNPGTELPNSRNDFFNFTQTDPVEKIEPYKESTESKTQNPVQDIPNLSNDSLQLKQTDSLRLALEEIKGFEKSRESNTQNPVQDIPNLSNDSLQLKQTDSLRLALEEIKGFEKSTESNSENSVTKSAEIGQENGVSKNTEVSMAVKLALEKAREYKQKKDIGGDTKTLGAGSNAENKEKQSNPIIQNKIKKKDDPKISSIDFAGLDFADKKQGRGLPAGLLPTVNPFTEENLPEVEIIFGDQSKFGNRPNSNQKKNIEKDENTDIYEPSVSTWGVFPRPRNISKTYGGGKVINPGDVLETEEESAAKEARARQLVAAYRNRVTLKIDPLLKSQCEKDLKDGDSLMDQGNLKQALPFYQKIMDKLPFETELHGLAALQWSICQDSLLKSSEARVMYEKLQSHPKAHINKKAKDFIFTFQAMEMMKVKSLDLSKPSTEYKSYFEAFVEDKSVILPVIEKTEEAEVDPLNQALPYIIFLFSPIIFVLFIALQKGSKF